MHILSPSFMQWGVINLAGIIIMLGVRASIAGSNAFNMMKGRLDDVVRQRVKLILIRFFLSLIFLAINVYSGYYL